MRAHPHSRGENNPKARDHISGAGSSPLTRGKRRLCRYHSTTRMAHPHSRGENRGVQVTVDPTIGSSPLTRGKHGPA